MSHESDPNSRTHANLLQRQFLLLWTQNQRRIFAYIYTLIPHRSDAEDLLQETSITLWEKFEEFEQGTDFVAWGCQVAYWKIRNARRKYARSPIIHDDDLLESLSNKAIAARNELDLRHDALAYCLKQLSDRDHALVMSRYEEDASIKDVAQRAGRTVDAAYKALSRIRQALLDCVTLRLDGSGS